MNQVPKKRQQKLSYKEQRELEQLPLLLEQLEQKIIIFQNEIVDPAFFQQSYEQMTVKLQKLAEAEQEFELAFSRWEYLEGIQSKQK